MGPAKNPPSLATAWHARINAKGIPKAKITKPFRVFGVFRGQIVFFVSIGVLT
jgi:hypothetical protein